MNTKKALNLIIVLLLVINIFLLVFIINFDEGSKEYENEITYVRDIMAYRGVSINASFNNEPSIAIGMEYNDGIFTKDYINQISELITGNIQSSEDETTISITLTERLKIPKEINDRYDADRRIRDFLDSISFNHINYLVDTVVMSGTSTYNVDYIYIGNNKVLYDLYISATIDEYGMKSIAIKYVDNQLIEGEKSSILPVTTILMSQIVYKENTYGKNTISRIDEGYKQDAKGKVYYCYRLTDGNQQVKYYNGVDGKEIK
ncbi:MAG: hypothetical protein KAG94_03250 [Clostridiales bacterium]|nr:hypothetical protein [Clostridiales bacterium]